MNALDMAGLVFIRTATSPTVSGALILTLLVARRNN